MILYEAGKRYWEIVTRFNRAMRTHKPGGIDGRPLMRKVASDDMYKLLHETSNAAVRSRILGWLARNQPRSPSNPSGNGGPLRRA